MRRLCGGWAAERLVQVLMRDEEGEVGKGVDDKDDEIVEIF